MKEAGRTLLLAARRELEMRFGIEVQAEDAPAPAWPFALGGVFATLELEGELRGCVGYFRRDEDVLSLARRAVVAAALDDPRFRPVIRAEVKRLSISLTILAPPVLISDLEAVVIGRDGLLIERGVSRGLLLPQVAVRRGWDAEAFASETCLKAGLPRDAWRDRATVIQRFEAVHFEEDRD
jgi:AmmeMemoRadiSam system protein A